MQELTLNESDNIKRNIEKLTQALGHYNNTQDYYVLTNQENIDIIYKPKSETTTWTYSPAGKYKLVYSIEPVTSKAIITIVSDKEYDQRARVDKLYSDKYMVTDGGLVISLINNKIMSQIYKNGYKRVPVRKNVGRSFVGAHRLVAHAFCPRSEHLKDFHYNDLQVNHKDGVKDNNHWTNLEWCTNQENIIHAIETGLKTFEVKPTEFIKQIRDDWSNYKRVNYTVVDHANKHNLTAVTMTGILKNETYYDPEYKPDMSRFGDRSGEDHVNAFLNQQQINEIRADYATNRNPYKYYIEKYNLKEALAPVQLVSRILNNETYIDPNYVVPEFIGKRKLTFEDATWIRQHKHDNPDTSMDFYAEKYSVDKTLVHLVYRNKVHVDPNYNFNIPEKVINTQEEIKSFRQDYKDNPNKSFKEYSEHWGISKHMVAPIIYNESYFDPDYDAPVKPAQSKMSDQEVYEMRQHKLANPTTPVKYYMEKYGIKEATVYALLTNRNRHDPNYTPTFKV